MKLKKDNASDLINNYHKQYGGQAPDVVKKKAKKPLYKKWWFWVIVVLVAGALAGGGGNDDPDLPIDKDVAKAEEPAPEKNVVENQEESDSSAVNPVGSKEPQFDGYTVITVDGGDRSGARQANVAVDIGFGDREYWAFTNEYGQLVRVVAKKGPVKKSL